MHANNILSAYEKYEEICFKYYKEILIPGDLTNEKDKTIEDYLNKLELIKKDDISKATKKYLMRYCLGDYDIKKNILKNMNIYNMFLKRDIWEEEIFSSPKFEEECKKLNKLNNENDNYLDKYFLYNIIKDDTIETQNPKIEINNVEVEKNEDKEEKIKEETHSQDDVNNENENNDKEKVIDDGYNYNDGNENNDENENNDDGYNYVEKRNDNDDNEEEEEN